MMVNTEIMWMYYQLSLQLKENGKTWSVLIEQTPDLVYSTMDIIRAQKMEFWLGPFGYTHGDFTQCSTSQSAGGSAAVGTFL